MNPYDGISREQEGKLKDAIEKVYYATVGLTEPQTVCILDQALVALEAGKEESLAAHSAAALRVAKRFKWLAGQIARDA